MNTTSRCCQSLLRSTRRANAPRRAFSRLAAQQKDLLPEYYESSSPQLDEVLTKINSKILFPQHLNHEQRLLVYKQKNIPRLTNEPLYAQIGSVDQQLEPLDIRKDVPNQWEMIKKAVELSKEQDDWENLVLMLEGFHRAGIKIRTPRVLKIIRRANEAQMQHVVLAMLQRAGTTGVSLRHPAVLEAVFAGIHRRASETGWSVTATKKAFSLAEQVADLMEMPAHVQKVNSEELDPRSSPLVISLPLELAATRVLLHGEGKDTDGRVAKYAVRLMAAFKQDDYFETTLPKLLSEQLLSGAEYDTLTGRKGAKQERLFEVKHRIEAWIPVWHALEQAPKVLGPDMPMAQEAQEIKRLIEERIKAAYQVVREHSAQDDNAPIVLRMKEVGLV